MSPLTMAELRTAQAGPGRLSEKDFSQQVYDLAQMLGWLVVRFPTWRPTGTMPGFPDEDYGIIRVCHTKTLSLAGNIIGCTRVVRTASSATAITMPPSMPMPAQPSMVAKGESRQPIFELSWKRRRLVIIAAVRLMSSRSFGAVRRLVLTTLFRCGQVA